MVDGRAHAGGDLVAALGKITAQFFVVPFSEDRYFPPEDCRADADLIRGGHYRPIETPMGHLGMFGLRPEDPAALDAVIAGMLTSLTVRAGPPQRMPLLFARSSEPAPLDPSNNSPVTVVTDTVL